MLDVSGITRRFGGLIAVSDASLAVREGEIVALIGPNGAGKTMLFSIVSGFIRPDAGTVAYRGEDITARPPHEICRLGLVRTFQVVQPFGRLSVRENIAVGAYLRCPDRADAMARAAEIAARLGMTALLDRPAAALTVAGRKRLEIARALATAPRLLLLDEVMAGLNPTEIDDVVGALRQVRDGGVTILMIEHVMQAVGSLADRAYVLNQGRIIAEGAPGHLAGMPQVVEAYLGHGAARNLAARAAAGGRR
jgi:branched-chain amino acid transport system ATP-binding protein